jgi:hypothetical protein
MARLHFKRITTPPPRQPVYEDEGAQQARRLQREGLRDVIWVAIGLALILVVGTIYQWSQGSDRRAARQRADAAARSAVAVPYAPYQTPPRYPTTEEIQAEQVVREARELAAANAAANTMDPALNQQLAKPTAPAYSPTPPSMFGPQPQTGAPAAVPQPGLPPPAATPQPSPGPVGPPR